jgi:acetoin utilization protein AcuC
VDFGLSHPLKPIRVQRTHDLIRACNLLRGQRTSVVSPELASEDVIASVHSREYIRAVQQASEQPTAGRWESFGLGTLDNPVVPGMYEAAALVVGASEKAAELVQTGTVNIAFNPAGGWHHAHRKRAAGFCIFNDPAIAIMRMLKQSGEGVKIAYVDLDAHHGDGVQEAFFLRRDVLTISLHENGRYLFPGTGRTEDIGMGEGKGYSVNLPFSPYTTDEVYLEAFKQVVPPLLQAYRPDFLVTQLGADTHYLDPLTHLCLTTHGYVNVIEELAKLGLRWVAIGGGGYDLTVVPRAWTLAFAKMAQKHAPELIPDSQSHHYRRDGHEATLHDTAGPSVDDDWRRIAREFAEQSVQELQERVFPYHGL